MSVFDRVAEGFGKGSAMALAAYQREREQRRAIRMRWAYQQQAEDVLLGLYTSFEQTCKGVPDLLCEVVDPYTLLVMVDLSRTFGLVTWEDVARVLNPSAPTVPLGVRRVRRDRNAERKYVPNQEGSRRIYRLEWPLPATNAR